MRPPGRPHDRLPDLLGRHRPEHDLPGLQRGGQARVAQGLVVEVGAERQDHRGFHGQLADRGDELPPLLLVLAAGEDRLELVHDHVPGLACQLRAEIGPRGGCRHEQRHRPGQPWYQARLEQGRLTRSRRSHHDQRQPDARADAPAGNQLDQSLRHVLAPEEPRRVLRPEAGQPAVGCVAAGHVFAGAPLVGRAPGPAQRLGPPREPGGIGLLAGGVVWQMVAHVIPPAVLPFPIPRTRCYDVTPVTRAALRAKRNCCDLPARHGLLTLERGADARQRIARLTARDVRPGAGRRPARRLDRRCGGRRKLALVPSVCLMAVSAAFAVQAYARSGQLCPEVADQRHLAGHRGIAWVHGEVPWTWR